VCRFARAFSFLGVETNPSSTTLSKPAEAKLPVLFLLPTRQTPAGSLAFNLLGFVCQYSPKGFIFSLQFETPTASVSVNPLFRSTVKLAVAFTTMSSYFTTLLMMGVLTVPLYEISLRDWMKTKGNLSAERLYSDRIEN
jgi:hypothetical protein